jgi:carboxyl-terminal processing protease
MKNKIYQFLFISAVVASSVSCRKTVDFSNTKIPANEIPPKDGSSTDLIKDSIFLYAKQVYLWNESLPTYAVFKPRQYSSANNDYDNFTNVLFQITRYGINPKTGAPYEYNTQYPTETKYSFIDDLVADGILSSINNKKSVIDTKGKGNDVGYGLSILGDPKNYSLYVRYVSPGSPAESAGLKRGDYFNQINGFTFGTNYDSEINNLNIEINKNTVTIVGKKQNGTPFTITINSGIYNSNPIYKDSVYSVGAKKIGYLAYARFSDTNNSVSRLDNTFANFTAAGVTDLVIDLRYNGGGYISTAEHLVDLISPTRLDKLPMFKEYFNNTMQSGQASILKNQPDRDGNGNVNYDNGKLVTLADYSYTPDNNSHTINKTGNLNNIENVVFIISKNTASASELVINSLKPYINVKTVGTTSYGKPVGFFPIRIGKYDLYYSMFSTKNSKGEGDYYSGMTPTNVIADDPTKEFGDITETNLATAIGILTNSGSAATTQPKIMMVKGKKVMSNNVIVTPIEDNSFKGMIETRVRK